MKKELVEVRCGKGWTDSLRFSEEFEIQHTHILEKIRNLTIKYPIVEKQFKKDEFTNERNRKYPFFWISRDGYMTLVMNMAAKGKSVELLFEKKQLFIKAFNKMEKLILQQQNNKQNLEWSKSREQGKVIRLEMTDVIKDFVEYAESQGSKNAKRYYSNITRMEYKALGFVQQSKPKLRDTLDLMELHQIILAEDLCKRQLRKYIDEKLHYKEIYILVKQDIENFGKILYLR